MKLKAAAEAGIKCTLVQLGGIEDGVGEMEVMAEVDRLNKDSNVHGIIVQLPLSDDIGREGERRITEAVSPEKDVDGYVIVLNPKILVPVFLMFSSLAFRFHAYNIGLLSSRASEPLFSPCTPAGVMLLLASTGIDIAGKNAVVLGRSDIVGSPVCALLRRKDATVTQCHSRTQNLESMVRCRFAYPPNLPCLINVTLSQFRSSKPISSSLQLDKLVSSKDLGSSLELS